MLKRLFRPLRQRRATALMRTGAPRKIRIHSTVQVPEEGAPQWWRVGFEFLDPPGPWSIQFYEAAPGQDDVLALLEPGTEARFIESEDGARTRVLVTSEGKPLLPA